MLRPLSTLSGFLLATRLLVAQAPGNDFFEQKIRPVLATRCYVCHSAQAAKVQGGFHLDTRDGLRKGGNSGPALVEGDPDSSLLIKALRYTDPSLQMPPGKALAPEVVKDFEAWVKMGAPDPRTAPTPVSVKATNKDWWAFRKPVRPAVPSIVDSSWSKTPVDNFIFAKLAEAKLKPAPAADRRTLIRRATYDLIGLPPTEAEITAFDNDQSSNAYEKVVDRLLASPQYGVRWGRHWMDVSRYADTADGANRFAFSYTYRDWVIKALNQDMPYDEFVKRQIAADKLNPADKGDLAALGYITLGRSVPKGEHDMIDDRIDAITRGFLGMTVTCARCHDHKFDPIPTRDYYSFYGMISNSVEPVEYPLLKNEDPNSPLVKEYRDGMQRRLAALQNFKTKRHAELVAEYRQPTWISRYLVAAQKGAKMNSAELEKLSLDADFNLFVLRRWRDYLNATRENNDPVFAPWNAFVAGKPYPANSNPEIRKALETGAPKTLDDVARIYSEVLGKADSPNVNPDKDIETLRLALRGDNAPANVPLADFIKIRGAGGDDNILRALDGDIRVWEAEFGYRGITPRAMALEDAPKITPAHVFIRGNPNNQGVETPPHFLTILSDKTETFTHGSGRLDLANAIVDKNNPLTARVLVNRVWTWHFGRGIVNSPSDFGTRGDLPSHPELLDYLATRFMDEGWSVKKLQRWIMLSNTYQQSSVDRPEARAVDPENKLLWRMNRQRLDYESLHDSVLFVSGQLDQTVGGLPFSLTAIPTIPRRAAYAYIQRGRLPGELNSFDFASPESHVPQRFLTTVPQQALFFMNSPFITEEAKHLLGRREVDSASGDSAKVAALYKLVYGRTASPEEVESALEFVKSETAKAEAAVPAVWQYGLTSLKGFEPLKNFVDQRWQPGPLTPAPYFGNADLSEKGGAPPDDPALAITRRWVSPVDGTIEITGTLTHKVEEKPAEYKKQWSDGIHVRITRNDKEILTEQTVNNKKVDLTVKELAVKKGDAIDFTVDCVKTAETDTFEWAPVIKSGDHIWDAKKDFAGPVPLRLSPWEKYAQVLLQTNEFAFVD
ncbi:MAG: hypothetical protein QOJ99_4869 [Bryobacterales bacterium]|jgi:hypothetical protein|nr:hypothetical protein [Bryobacterales bacterium]